MTSLSFRRLRLPAVALFALFQSTASLVGADQLASDTAPLVNPARVVFQHDGKNVSGFVLYLQPDGGAIIRMDLGALKPDGKGVISAKLPQLPPGMYRVDVAAYNSSGESPRVPADPPTLILTDQSAARPELNHETHARSEPAREPEPKKTDDSGSKKKDGVGRRFWKVLVGGDDKP